MEKSQEEYRKFFGIEDNFLIQMEMDEEKNEGFIVYIDKEDDINWNDTRKKYFDDEEKARFNLCLAKLNLASLEPCTNISHDDLMAFRMKLAVGFALALVKGFDDVQKVIDESLVFLKARNREFSRTIFVSWSLPIVLACIVLWIINIEFVNWHSDVTTCCLLGIIGSYVSIWQRFGNDLMTGLSSSALHKWETVSRLAIGGIFAIVALFAFKCGLVLSNIANVNTFYVYGMIGFVAGFSERFVPMMVEEFEKSK